MKGPAIFLAQFVSDEPPFNELGAMAGWASALGYKGIQIPTWDARLIDLERAATSKTYCDEIAGICADAGVEISELSTHLQGQLVASHPAYGDMFDVFAPESIQGNGKAKSEWAEEQVRMGAKASANLGLAAHATFSGALLWHTFYPWPQRPAGMVEEGFAELARRWRPLLDAFDDAGVDACFELHPGEGRHVVVGRGARSRPGVECLCHFCLGFRFAFREASAAGNRAAGGEAEGRESLRV